MTGIEIMILDLYKHDIANKKMTLKCVDPVTKKQIICDYDTAVKNKYDFVCLETGLTFDDIINIIRINNHIRPQKNAKKKGVQS